MKQIEFKNCLNSRLQLLQQAIGKCSMYFYGQICSISTNAEAFISVVCCLKLQGNLSLAELIRDGLIRNRNLLALTT